MPPASLSALAVMMPGPISARAANRRMRHPPSRPRTAPPGMVVRAAGFPFWGAPPGGVPLSFGVGMAYPRLPPKGLSWSSSQLECQAASFVSFVAGILTGMDRRGFSGEHSGHTTSPRGRQQDIHGVVHGDDPLKLVLLVHHGHGQQVVLGDHPRHRLLIR